MSFALKPRAPRWAIQPSMFYLLLNVCLLTGILHYWLYDFNSPATVSVWVGREQPSEQRQHEYEIGAAGRMQSGNAVLESATVGYGATSCAICAPDNVFCKKYGPDVLARSRSYEGANARFLRVLRDAKAGKAVNIYVLGGSVTKGQGVKPDENWVTVYAEWWKSEFPNSKLTIQNGAVAATGTGYMSMCFLEHIDADADIVMTEFAINDQRLERNAESFEWLIRQLLDLPKQPAVLNLHTFGVGYAQITTGGDLHTANYYDTPVISLRNALLPQLLGAPSAAAGYFARIHTGDPDFRHINNRGHRMLAELLASYLKSGLFRRSNLIQKGGYYTLHEAMVEIVQYTQLQVCRHITQLSLSSTSRSGHDSDELPVDVLRMPTHRLFQNFNDPPAPRLHPFYASTSTAKHLLVPAFNDGRWNNWTYTAVGGTEKRYIVAKEPGARIAFKVPVRSRNEGGEAMGRVRVTFLQSKTLGLGIIKCWLDDDMEAIVHVDGFWNWPLNLANTAVVSKNATVGEHMLWCELTPHTYDPKRRTEFRFIGVDAA